MTARISAWTLRRLTFGLVEPFATSRGAVDELGVVELSVRSDEHVGTGWAVPATRLTGETQGSIEAALQGPIRAALTVPSLDEPAALWRALDGCIPGNRVAKAAADLALHELLAHRSGTSLELAIGAGPTPQVATDVTVSLAAPDRMATAAARRADEGYTALKLKVGTGPTAIDVGRVLAVRDAAPGCTLRLDANQAWTADQAVRVLDSLHRHGVVVEFVEQPVAAGDIRGLRWVRARSPFPIMADESVVEPRDVLRLAEAEAADMINIKLAKHGGLAAARRVIAVAEAADLPCMVGSMLELPATIAASVALAATTEWPAAHDLDAAAWLRSGAPGPGVEYRPPLVRGRSAAPPG